MPTRRPADLLQSLGVALCRVFPANVGLNSSEAGPLDRYTGHYQLEGEDGEQ